MSKVKKSFRKNMYRGVELSEVLDKPINEIVSMLNARQRRRYKRGVPKKYESLLKKLRKSKETAAKTEGEKPKGVKTHLRNCIVTPEMVGSLVEVYSGKTFVPVEVKADMIGYFLAEFSLSYKPVTHGKLGVGATRSSKFTATT
jgi:small subunit ribosomal protein S15e